MKGYYKQPELTNEVIKDGWLHTEIKAIDEDYLFIREGKRFFKTSKGKYIEPLVLESYFADITDFEQIVWLDWDYLNRFVWAYSLRLV